MIDYDGGFWGVGLIFSLHGSVIPKAACWAIPCGLISFTTFHVYYTYLDLEAWDSTNVTTIWSSFTFILGFLIVFRTQKAYDRYWQGAMLLRQARGEWFSAYSSCIAFCSGLPDKKDAVERWQHLLARLFSMLNCVALQTVADMSDCHFEYFDNLGIEAQHMKFLAGKQDPYIRMEILIQWVQRHIMKGSEDGIVSAPPPVLSRAFQEISRGAVNFNQMRNFSEIPFPFPYAQMLSVMLLMFCICTPLLSGLVLGSGAPGAAFTFISVLAFWATNYIAAEIENPFGDDLNDLPLKRLQQDMNTSLWSLLEKIAHTPPAFTFNKSVHRMSVVKQHSFSVYEGSRESPSLVVDKLTSRSSEDVDKLDKKASQNMSNASSRTSRSRRRKKAPFGSSSPTPMGRITCTVNFDEQGLPIPLDDGYPSEEEMLEVNVASKLSSCEDCARSSAETASSLDDALSLMARNDGPAEHACDSGQAFTCLEESREVIKELLLPTNEIEIAVHNTFYSVSRRAVADAVNTCHCENAMREGHPTWNIRERQEAIF